MTASALGGVVFPRHGFRKKKTQRPRCNASATSCTDRSSLEKKDSHRIDNLKICTTLGYIVSLELGTRVSLSNRQPCV